jgi:hypothetical protein
MLLCCARRIMTPSPPLPFPWSLSPSREQPPSLIVLLVLFGLLFACWSFAPSCVAFVLPFALMGYARKNSEKQRKIPPPVIAGFHPLQMNNPLPPPCFWCCVVCCLFTNPLCPVLLHPCSPSHYYAM